jgi:hypothetical protein
LDGLGGGGVFLIDWVEGSRTGGLVGRWAGVGGGNGVDRDGEGVNGKGRTGMEKAGMWKGWNGVG